MVFLTSYRRASGWAQDHPVKATSMSGLALQMARPLVTLITLPLLLQALGESGFGVWLIGLSVMGILNFVSAGVSSGLVTYAGRISGSQNDTDADGSQAGLEEGTDVRHDNPDAFSGDITARMSQLATVGFLIAVVCAISVFALVLPLVMLLDWGALLRLDDPVLGREVRYLMVAVLAVLGVSFIAVIPRQVMFGRLHGYFAHVLDFTGVLMGACGLIATINLGAPMWVMALALVGPSAVFLFLGGLVYLVRAGIRPFDLSTFDAALFRRFRDDALRMSGYHVAFTVSSQTDILLIGIVLGSAATVDFGIAHRVFSLLVAASLVLNHAQWPVLARADASGNRAVLIPLFRRALTLVPLGAVLLAALLVLFYEPLVELWLGEVLHTDPLILWGMVAWVCVATMTNTCDSLLRARNKTSFLMRAMGIMAVLNLVITLLLLPLIGAAGAIWGSVIGYLVAVLVPYMYHLRADIWGRAA